MAGKGPRPKPTAIKKARGTDRPDRRSRREPDGGPGRPDTPDWFGPVEAAVWEWLIPALEEQGTLGSCDRNMLSRYCTMWSQWRDCQAVIEAKGQTYEVFNEAGEMRFASARPEAGLALKLDAAMRRIEQEFGLSPSARTRIEVKVPTKAEPDKRDDFFKVVAG